MLGIQSPCQRMIGLSNHLQNAEYLGSSSILRRWLDPYREIGCFENSYISNLNPLFSRKIGGILKKLCKIWLVILIPSASTSQHMSTGLWGEPTLHMRNGGVTGQPYNPCRHVQLSQKNQHPTPIASMYGIFAYICYQKTAECRQI